MLGVPLQIGPLSLKSNLLLAPIAGWCDLAWRVTCRELGGVGLACTDLLSPHGLLCGSEASEDLARTNDLDSPIGMQLYGPDPGMLADAARWCVDHGATVVDINMGCPVDKVCKKNAGSKLMCDSEQAARIVASVRKALPEQVPLTAKMRLGWAEVDADANAAGVLACRLIDEGVSLLTIHGRTAKQHFKGQCNLQGIARVVEAVADKTGRYTGMPGGGCGGGEGGGGGGGGVPVVGNGDVRTPMDVVRMLEQTGCAGVMIGRGAFGMPWIFRAAWEAQLRAAVTDEPLTHANTWTEPSENEKIEIVRRYVERMIEYRDAQYALPRIRKKISWLGKSINGSHCRPLKEAIRKAATVEEVFAALDAWARTPHGLVGMTEQRLGEMS